MKLTPWLRLVEKCNGDGGGDKLAPSVYHISPTRKHATKDPIGNQREKPSSWDYVGKNSVKIRYNYHRSKKYNYRKN